MIGKMFYVKLFCLLCCVMPFTACDEELVVGDWPPMEWETDVKISSSCISVPTEGGIFVFHCKNYENIWISYAEENGTFLNPTPESDWRALEGDWWNAKVEGVTMTVSIASNPSAEKRVVEICPTAGDIFHPFVFEQAGKTN